MLISAGQLLSNLLFTVRFSAPNSKIHQDHYGAFNMAVLTWHQPRCGDAVEEGCDPCDELEELDALSERLRFKRFDLKRNINRFHSPIALIFCNRCRLRCCRRGVQTVGWGRWTRCLVTTPQTQTIRSKKEDKPNSLCHHPSTSYGRYVDHFWVLPTRFYGSLTFTRLGHQRGHFYPLRISWSYLQLWEGDCLVNA